MRFRSIVLFLATGAITLAQNSHENSRRRDDLKKPLVIAGQGSILFAGIAPCIWQIRLRARVRVSTAPSSMR